MRKILIYICAIFTFTHSAFASPDIYSQNISVDVSDKSAALAQEKAMTYAQRQAFIDVLNKITTSKNVESLSSMEDTQIVNFIKAVSVIWEKRSEVRYIANLKISIKEDLLKEYLQSKNIDFSEPQSTKILVIPVFREFKTDQPLLWQSANTWRKAWESSPVGNGPIKIYSIPVNGDNYLALSVQQALSLNKQAMSKLAKINKISTIYVADATYNGIEGLHINLSSYANGKENDSVDLSVDGDRNADLFNKAINVVKKHIEDKIKEQNISESKQKNQIMAIFNYSSVKQLKDMENTLQNIGYIKKYQIISLNKDQAMIEIDFIGSIGKLNHILNNQRYLIKTINDNYALEKF